MKALILAAGLGRRMYPLTRTTPKPMLEVRGKPLIQHHVEALCACGVKEVVVNLFHLGEVIENFLEDGSRFGIRIQYSWEDELLETGGGARRALRLLGGSPFVVVNGDIFTDYDFKRLPENLPEDIDGHLVMVSNPVRHAEGDFCLSEKYPSLGWLLELPGGRAHTFTYSGISVLHPRLFAGTKDEAFPLLSVLVPAIKQSRVSGEHFRGQWTDVGTIEILKGLGSA